MSTIEPIIFLIDDLAAKNDLTREQAAADVMRELANYFDLPTKIWQPEDLRGYAEADPQISDEDVELIIETATGSPYWFQLADCNGSDWQLVESAVEDARSYLGFNK